MGLNIAALLIHDEAVPSSVREALRTASIAPPADRDSALMHAAHVLYTETDLDCRDVRDLVGITADRPFDDCGC